MNDEAVMIEGWAAPFGGPANGRDLHGERFSKATDFALQRQTDRPLLFEHGFDAEIGKQRIGTVIEHRVTDLGLWVRAQLDRRSKYYDYIRNLIEKGALSFSTGAAPELVRTLNGEILSWPWEETSLTPTPANPTALVRLASKGMTPAMVEELSAIKRQVRNRELADLARIKHELQVAQLKAFSEGIDRAKANRAIFAESLRLNARMHGVPV